MPLKTGKLMDADRAMLTSVLDRLVPAVDDLPSAGKMGLGSKVEQLSQKSEPFKSALLRVLDAFSLDPTTHASGGFLSLPEDERDAAIREVEEAMPGVFSKFLELVYIVYYSEPQVHQRIGWQGGPVQPKGFALAPFDESILEKAKTRREFWRKV